MHHLRRNGPRERTGREMSLREEYDEGGVMNELHLFAGAGGGILGGLLLGHAPVCAVELEAYPRSVLLQRQRDGILPWFPVWDDVRTFDGNPWKGQVDIISGGFPCNGISSIGDRDAFGHPKTGLWKEMVRVIREVRPEYVFVENVQNLLVLGLGDVLGDLAGMGFDAAWGMYGAHQVQANHRRERIWVLAHTRRLGRQACKETPRGQFEPHRCDWWMGEPGMGRLDDGTPNRMDRLRCLGMLQVPAVAALAFTTLHSRLMRAV